MHTRFLVVAALLATLTACESDSSGPPPVDEEGVVEIDASSSTDFTYFSLADGEVVAVADPSASTDWDLALRRFEVRLNGGVSGPGDVAGVNLENNVNATPEQILAFTPENTQAEFDAVGEAAIPVSTGFVADGLEENPLGWLSFGPTGPVANPSAVWQVRTASGDYAVFRATGLTMGGSDPQSAQLASVTLEWRAQPAGGTLGSVQTATLDLTSGNSAIDFAGGALVAPVGCGWDLTADAASFSLLVNDTCGTGTFPIDAVSSLDDVDDASDASEYAGFLAGRAGAVPFSSSLDDPAGPFLYNLAGDNRLTPTYNIYLVQVGEAVYKIQLIGYYSATGSSGHPTIRYARIR